MQRSHTKSTVLAALFLAAAYILPFFTGQIPQIGQMLLPMHLPVMLCGFLLGPSMGLAVGCLAPLSRSLFLGMPPMFPHAVAMAFELAVYGAACGFLGRRLPKTPGGIYLSLVCAMLAGRAVWGAVRFALTFGGDSTFPFSAFLAGAFTNAVPGILLQLILVPPIVLALEKARVGAAA